MTAQQDEAPRILGTLHAAGETGLVRIQDTIPAPPDEVWAALTDPARLADWLGEVTGDLRAGGEYHGRWRVSGWDGSGRILVCDPPRRLALSAGEAGEAPHRMEIAVAPAGAGSSVVVEEQGMPLEQLAAYGAGTQVHVEDLAAHLTGAPARHAVERWSVLFPGYQALRVEGLEERSS